MAPQPPKSFIFGPYRLDPEQRVLLRDGKRVQLAPKAMTILCVLVENRGKLVEREELLQKVWPDVFVEEGNLTFNVFALRKVLAEGLKGVSPIETVPKRGYRFTAPVEAAGAPTAAAPLQGSGPQHEALEPATGDLPGEVVSAGHDTAVRKRRRNRLPALFGLIAIGCGLAAGLILHFSGSAAHARPARMSLLVLPFHNLTGNPASEYLSDSFTQELITRLAGDYRGEVAVLGYDTALSYKGTRESLPKIAKELGVQYAIDGSVMSERTHIRVSVCLVRASSQTSVWGGSYDGDVSQLLQFEDSVSRSVGRELSLKLLAGRKVEHIPRSVAAYNEYLEGLYFLSQRTRTSMERALERFAAATAGDPQYAQAYAELAVTYNLMGEYTWATPGYAHTMGKAAAEQAIAAQPTLAEGHAALGFSDWFYEWNQAAADRELRRAIQLDPNNVDAHHWRAQVLMTSGRFAEAEREIRAALDIDPKSLILQTNLGWLYYFERRYPAAIAQLNSVVRESPDFVTAHYKLWEAYSAGGDQTNAWKELRQLARLLCDAETRNKVLAAYQQGGYPNALKLFASFSPPDNPGSYVDRSRFLISAGDKADAINFLERAYAQRDGWMIFTPIDPAFDPLRSNPRFGRLILHPLSTN